jgi:hypothetical protein
MTDVYDIRDFFSGGMAAALVTVTEPKRTKAKAGEQEKRDIDAIVAAIHGRTARGLQLIDAFRTATGGQEILDARARTGGNRNTHYDFEILVGDMWRKVEHKGSAACVPVNPADTPWAAGVQFHNGGCEKYAIARAYTRVWYDLYVGSGRLAAEWGLTSAIPSYEEWYMKDAKVQGDPKTAFGLELKAAVRAVRGERGSLLELREEVNAAFNPTPEELRAFGEEALVELRAALEQKEFWLTVHGDPASSFHCHWWPQFTLAAVESVTLRKEKDLFFDIVCADGMRFSCLLRWGKGAGFSNVRMDAR